MRCLLCGDFSWRYLCPACEASLTPSPAKHSIEGSLSVFSFFPYDDIEPLIKTKYHPFGSLVLRRLAQKAFSPFFNDLALPSPAALVPIDDRPGAWFSHTAALAKEARGENIRVRYGKLRATSKVHYAGQSLAFRKANPRRFRMGGFKEEAVILLDDLMTTGTTLQEAAQTVEKTGKSVLFAVVLAAAD